MATVTVRVSSALGQFEFEAEVAELRAYGAEATVNGATEKDEIGRALDRAFSAARRAYEIEEAS